ncbi:MAG: riboflavin synthase [Chitinispirillaceae bacterium]
MFTGLIETMGTITGLKSSGRSVELCIRPDIEEYIVEIGGSVSIDGTCLTVEKCSGRDLFFTAVQETLRRTTLSAPKVGRRVNLERALQANGRFDGHIVLGHVDGTGQIVSDHKEGVALIRTIRVPSELQPFMAQKGSVAIDGVSLTIAEATEETVSISLIPHTIGKTTISVKKPGDAVNLECDVLARYLLRMMKTEKSAPDQDNADRDAGLLEKMERFGF